MPKIEGGEFQRGIKPIEPNFRSDALPEACDVITDGRRKYERMSTTKDEPAVSPGERDGKIRLGPLENFIGFNLRLAQDASFQTYAQHVGKPQLGPGRFAAMMLIHQNPDISQKELSRAIARDKSSVTPLVQTLLREGLITRTPSETDRRRAHLRLTQAGEGVLKTLLARAEEHDRKLDAIVGDRKAELLDLLKKIVKNLT